ncbi:MAG: hypothetical protein AAF708_05915 [Deinococcota bacterium]
MTNTNLPTHLSQRLSQRLMALSNVKAICFIFTVLISFNLAQVGMARDWYVSANTGGGRTGSIDEPAKEISNIVRELAAGDRIFVAEGIYTGRGDSGHDLINVPVEIYCGYDTSFSQRDPWGAHASVFSGENTSSNASSDYRLKIDLSKDRNYEQDIVVVDGCIFDNGNRNHYQDDRELLLIRSASPASGNNPSPESGGLQVKLAHEDTLIVRNNIVLNTAPTVGAFSLWGHQNSLVTVENNLAINNTGNGFALHTQWRSASEITQFNFSNNASLFTEKHDAYGNIGGSALIVDNELSVDISSSVLAFSDNVAINNAAQAEEMSLANSVVFGSLVADYLEFDIFMSADEILDDAYYLYDEGGNSSEPITLPVSEAFQEAYLARSVLDRNAIETSVNPEDSYANAWRSILGLNLQAGTVTIDSDVWLPRLSLEEALTVAGSFAELGVGPQVAVTRLLP